MKTLDEVIKNFEICRKARLNLISCDGCTYAIGDNDFCIDCNEIDVLEWLKGYRAHIELDKLRDKYSDTSQITCPKCHSEFVILPDANNPLTWDELRTMEGKPVLVEWISGTWKGLHKWILIRRIEDLIIEFTALDVARVSYDGNLQKYCLGKTWQAYQKERL